MSLKTTYLEGPNGFTERMNLVYLAGKDFVTANLTTLANALANAAASGQKAFDVIIDVTFEPTNLRLKGTHMETYFNGITSALSEEEIYNYECTLTLMDNDSITTRIKFSFSF